MTRLNLSGKPPLIDGMESFAQKNRMFSQYLVALKKAAEKQMSVRCRDCMKYFDHTTNTGHIAVHDTDASIDSDVLLTLHSLMMTPEGIVPGMPGISYQFQDCGELAYLSTFIGTKQGPCPIWTTIIFADDADVMDIVASFAESLQVQCKLKRLSTPGLVTTLFTPGCELAGHKTITVLADFAKCIAGAWLEGKI